MIVPIQATLYQGRAMGRPEATPYDYVVAEQGIIKRVENRYVSTDMHLIPFHERLPGLGLQRYSMQPLRFKLPPIPENLLLDALADARQNIDLEFMYHFRFAKGERWYVTKPQQIQTKVHLGYDFFHDPDSLLVFDLHSHNTMEADFSWTDNQDEREGRFYGIMGRLDLPNPHIIIRLGAYGHWLTNIPARHIFSGIGPFVDRYDSNFAGGYGTGSVPYQENSNEGAKESNWLTTFAEMMPWRWLG